LPVFIVECLVDGATLLAKAGERGAWIFVGTMEDTNSFGRPAPGNVWRIRRSWKKRGKRMNHQKISSFQSNRLPSRHLRRFAQSASAHLRTVLLPPVQGTALQTLVGLSTEAVRDAGVLQLLAAEMRIAKLEKALEEVQSMAFTDPLTGALNRRGFGQACVREMARSRRNGQPLALVLIDIDDFKALNDQHGHLVGDRVLVHLVRVLQDSMRPSDILCRFGGEEFLLLLPDTTVGNACKVAQRFLSEFSQSAPVMGRTMTFSAGVVEHDGLESLDEALQRADAATYAAKRTGKNRVMAG
jgi:diguanylate cyclase